MGLFDSLMGPGGAPPITAAPGQYAQMSGVPTPGPALQAQPFDPSQMTAPGAVVAPAQPRNALQSLLHSISLAGQNIGQGINSTPQALLDSGLISDSDLKHARSHGLLDFGLGMLGSPAMGTFGQSVAGGFNNMRQGFDSDINQDMQRGQEAYGINYQRSILQARSAIGQMYAPQPGDTPQQIATKKLALSQHLQSIGDLEGAKAAGSGLDAAYGNLTQPLKVDWKDTGSQMVPVDQFGRQVPWLSPMPRTGSPMSPQEQAFHQQSIDLQRQGANEKVLNDYENEVKPYTTASRQIQAAYAAIPGAQKHNITDEQELLYNALNLAHPGMTVPRNEVQNFQGSVGPIGNVSKLLEKFNNGTGGALLTDAQVAQLSTLVKNAHTNAIADVAPIRQDYLNRAKNAGIDQRSIRDPLSMLPAPGSNPLDRL